VKSLDYSPIKGPEGNIEYLIYLKKRCGSGLEHGEVDAIKIVNKAHEM
jgi:23S rRNA (cytidine1920-2'-O)/16S rRNA (cytidine1409-2'-O)-methyltransferase